MFISAKSKKISIIIFSNHLKYNIKARKIKIFQKKTKII